MKKLILDVLKSKKNKRFNTVELEKEIKQLLGEDRGVFFYRNFGQSILELESEGIIKKIKSSKKYNANTSLFNKYQIIERKEEIDNELITTLFTEFHPSINTTIYFKNNNKLEEDIPLIKQISSFLNNKNERTEWISLNERSYELFGDEKFLASNDGQKLLKDIAITTEDLCSFQTYEPFFYYRKPNKQVENILIIENKDTFFSLKRLMLEGITAWDGKNISLLIYGEGGKITKSIEFMEELDINRNIPIYYYGDLDPEGISIYYRTKKRVTRDLKPFTFFYEALWERRNQIRKWENHRCSEDAYTTFFSYFSSNWSESVRTFLEDKGCVPQEGVNLKELRRLADGAF
ncbi:Wadjet anti-phage system protein JetD domain-containing protein [Bacillus sp. m3-13]|uniref:Wadjet anti-phage system protein JetD domain-containing protein n=1 Tax=Bacillus sp. m3-13 TaxID=406124 RepID=UPI0001E89DAD|nr:Wadjet anti-phage system protein JetD domain-containing protein [Bacillus sp. m3-13]